MLECGTLQYCYTVEPSLKSVCNCDFDVERSSWDDHDIDKHPGVYAAVQDFLQTEEGRHCLRGGPRVGMHYARSTTTISAWQAVRANGSCMGVQW